jgi:plastocyanin
VHHEIWDYDNANSPLLFDIELNGKMRKVLAHTGKTGFTYLLDRTNGEPLIGIEERPVKQDPTQKTAATQPFPIGDPFIPLCAQDPVPGYEVGCLFDPLTDKPLLIAPGAYGGSDYSPVSFNAKTGLLYVGATINNWAFGIAHERIDPITHEKEKLDGIGLFVPNGTKRSGNITAIDPKTNKIVWQKPSQWMKGMGSGMMSTAGGLLFSGDSDGNFVAYDAKTGDEVWRFQTGFGADGPAITYMINGEQYVAIATGGNSGPQSARGDAVWAFKLDGALGPLEAPKPPPTVATITSAPVAVDTVAIGRNWNGDLKVANIVNEYGFGPENISVPVGTTVTFTNQGDVAHTASSETGVFDTGLLSNGESYTFTFDTPGTYGYFCAPHPWMLGQVIVN